MSPHFGAFRPDHHWLKQNGLQRCKPFNMADSGGFEPPTARFVAEYSIQLSYESVTDHSKATALGYASLKPNSECSFRKLNCASSLVFASPTLRSLRFREIFGVFIPDHLWLIRQPGLRLTRRIMAEKGGFEPPTPF